MFGLIAYRTEETPPVQVIDGVRFRAVGVTRGESLRARLSARAAAGTLRQADVRYALFPADYPYAAPFARCGVVSPPLAPLYRAAATYVVDTENKSIQDVVDEVYKLSQADFVCS